MQQTAVLNKEEYIEQAYFFRVFRERLLDGQAAQEILAHLHAELLSTTQLVYAAEFMLSELKHSGQLAEAIGRLGHYFTPFQHHVLAQTERDDSRFTMVQGLLILEREAEYRAEQPTPAGLLIYQLEALSRNQLGYAEGLTSMLGDAFYDEEWQGFVKLIRTQLGLRDFAELVFSRSEHYVLQRRKTDASYEPSFRVLFAEKEGKIAAANRGKDPMYLFATLQRQLGYPQVPRPPKVDPRRNIIDELTRKVSNLEARMSLFEADVTGELDISKFYVKKNKPNP
jgi:hypothetical protein